MLSIGHAHYWEATSKYHKPFNKLTSPVTEGQHLHNLLFLSHLQLTHMIIKI